MVLPPDYPVYVRQPRDNGIFTLVEAVLRFTVDSVMLLSAKFHS